MNEDAKALVGEAQGALAEGRWSSAAASFRTLLDQNEDPDARFGLGIGLFWTGETVAALTEWERAYVVYRRRGDYPQAVLAAGYLCLAYRMSMGNDAAARGWLARATRLVSDHGLADMTSWVLVCRAHLAVDAGQLQAAEGWAREACDLARAAGDLDLELCALSELGAAVVELGRRRDLLGNYLAAFDAEPTFAERFQGATRESRVVGKTMRNFYRQSYGPGWALVGDAGYHKDAVTAQGISDAFRDAEALTDALDAGLSGRQPFERALAAYQEARDATTMPMFELTCQLASFDPPTPEEGQLFAAVAADQQASQDFVSTLAGSMPVPEFFDPTNVELYLAA